MVLVLVLGCLDVARALSNEGLRPGVTRKQAILQTGCAAACLPLLVPQPLMAQETKLTKLSDEELAKRVTADVVDRQFLATADFTRALFDESATFTDEIDTYTLPKFIEGTKKLFDASRSKVELTSPVVVDNDSVSFRFSEYLCFNLPVVQPIVSLSGKVVLTRDANSGPVHSIPRVLGPVALRGPPDRTPLPTIEFAALVGELLVLAFSRNTIDVRALPRDLIEKKRSLGCLSTNALPARAGSSRLYPWNSRLSDLVCAVP